MRSAARAARTGLFTGRSRRMRGGFTLLETMLTLVLILMLASATLPAISSWRARMPLEQTESEIRRFCLQARIAAIRSGTTQSVQLSVAAIAGLPGDAEPRTTARRFLAPSAIRSIQTEDLQGRPLSLLLFRPGGTATAAKIQVKDQQGGAVVLRLDRLTGMVTVEDEL